MRPASIEARLKFRQPIYGETAAYGHMGRQAETVSKTFSRPNSNDLTLDVKLFTWKKLDYIDKVKAEFSI